MRVHSEQLGDLEIPEDNTVVFPFGIPSFPDAQRFCLLEVRPGSRFRLLQCIERSNLAFVVIDPLQVEPGYPLDHVRLAASNVIEPDDPLAVAAIVTVPPPPGHLTVNLLAPIVMGLRSRRGVQVILHDSAYRVRHAL